MAPKARVQKRLYYKIGEACKALDIQPYVLRYWETEFPLLSPNKSRSGQRVYSEKELGIIRRIKELLYEEGYTIAGAKKKLEAELASGSLGEPEGEPEAAPGAPEAETARPEAVLPLVPPEPKPRPRPATAAPSVPAAPDVAASPAAQLDTQAAERIESMRKGITDALHEAREILALLSPKSPPRSSV
ncbi:MAG TPA: MerR family transcriptional regulator [Thermoanaerobaculia bacterium]|nr:MerR family transcriptional regulator [Thermoanaerobaculia bacterium]